MKVVGEVRSVETTLKGTKFSPLRTLLGFLPKGLPMSFVALKSAAPKTAIVRMANGRLRGVFLWWGFGLSVLRLSVVPVKPRVEACGRVKEHGTMRFSPLYRGTGVLLCVDSVQVPCLMPSCRNCGLTRVSEIAGALAPAWPQSRCAAVNLVTFRLAMLRGNCLIAAASANPRMRRGLVDRSRPTRLSQSCGFWAQSGALQHRLHGIQILVSVSLRADLCVWLIPQQ